MIRPFAIACVVAFSAGPGNAAHLALRVRTDGRVVWSAPIRPGEAFDIGFRHSSELCDWTHHFVVTPDASIRQLSSTFASYGAGMPSAVPDGTTLIVSADGFTVAAPLLLHELVMMGSTNADLHLRYRSRIVPLSPLLREFDPFSIAVEP